MSHPPSRRPRKPAPRLTVRLLYGKMDRFAHQLQVVDDKEDHLHKIAHQLLDIGRCIMEELEKLTKEVEDQTSAVDSAVTLIEGLSQQLKDLADGSTTLKDLKAAVLEKANEMDANSQRLADAVAANTPESGGGDAGGGATDPAAGGDAGTDPAAGGDAGTDPAAGGDPAAGSDPAADPSVDPNKPAEPAV